jgi:hypothetical protein
MLKGNNRYYFVLIVLFGFLVWIEYSTPKPIDWRRTYAQRDKIPYGCNAFYRLLDEDIYKDKLEKQKQTPFNVLLHDDEKKSAYFFITNYLAPSKLDSKYLLQFAEEGNDVFLAANDYQGTIADTFKIRTSQNMSFDFYKDTNKVFGLNFCAARLKAKKNYAYKKTFNGTYFSDFDSGKVSVLAVENDSNAIFLKANWGKGHVYFLSVPDVYTNYFVVNNPNREFAYKTLSYISADKILWDEYYKAYNEKTGGPLQFIFGNDSLYSAYLVALISLLIFMLFALKRRQRAIPVVEPLPNTTLQFVEVIGSVYYNSGNHKTIAEEKILSFCEFLRTKFSMVSRQADEETITRISQMSTIPLSEVKNVFRVMNRIDAQGSITERELIELNKSIENFYKLNKR